MRRKKSIASRLYPTYFLIPGVAVYAVLMLAPNLASFYYSFTNWNVLSENIKFIGFDNFVRMVTSVSGIVKVTANTLTFAFGTTALKIVIGLLLALALSSGLKTSNVLRGVYFLPFTLSAMLLGLAASAVLKPDGLLNSIFQQIGLDFLTHDWTVESGTALGSTIGLEVWRASGFAMVLFLASIQMIPTDLYEAARIDGANGTQNFWYITVPFLYHAFVLNIIMGVTAGLQVFDTVYMLTNGGPGRLTEVLNITVLNEFSKGMYGYSTALGLVLFLFIAAVYFILNAILKKLEVDVS